MLLDSSVQPRSHQIIPGVFVTQIPLLNAKNFDLVEVGLGTRYPASRRTKNTGSEMVVCFTSGKVDLHLDGKVIKCQPGDHAVIPQDTPYYWNVAPGAVAKFRIYSSPPYDGSKQVQVD